MDSDAERQRAYYTQTADSYDEQRSFEDADFIVAVDVFRAFAKRHDATGLIEIGAGTGRAMRYLSELDSGLQITGVEPVAALREVGHRAGISQTRLIDGDALKLAYPDRHFDMAIEFGVLHHIADARRAIAEMLRVSRKGIMVVDSNKYGQGSKPVRRAKDMIRRLGLWNTMIRIQTRGKMSKWSDDDGLYYSFSLFDHIDQIRKFFPNIYVMNTSPIDGLNLRSDAASALLVATL